MSFFLPPGRQTPGPEDLLRFVPNCLARACMDTRFKRLVGWRGLAACPDLDGAITCRLASQAGVYGIVPDSHAADGAVVAGRFVLHYFPHPDEPLFETLAPANAMLVAADHYRDDVRTFSSVPALLGPFAIAAVTVGLGRRKNALVLALETRDRHRIVSECGIPASDGWVVVPGGIEQEIPAAALASDFFAVLAAAASLCTGEPPSRLRRDRAPAGEHLRKDDGSLVERPCPGNRHSLLALGWGAEDETAPPLAGLDDASEMFAWRTGAPLPADLAAAPYWRSHDLQALVVDGAHPAAADRRPSLIVLCGFLGSGKTTLVNQIIEHYRNHDAFVAVIQNEIGATGVDAHLIEESESVECLDEGCVCCTLAGSLAKGAQRLIERFHPEHIVLETTGLANPLNLVEELTALAELVRLDVIVTVVDAVHLPETLAASEVARDQIRGGDVLVLNKCDLVGAETLPSVRARLRELNRAAPIIETSFARVHPAVLLGDVEPVLSPTCATARHPRGGPEPQPLHPQHGGPAHDPEHPDRHDHHPHDHHAHGQDRFSTIQVMLPPDLSGAVLFEALDSSPGPVFRIKGIVDLAEAGGCVALQCVGTRREIMPLPSAYDGPPFLTFIGQDLDVPALRAHWAAVTHACNHGRISRESGCSCEA